MSIRMKADVKKWRKNAEEGREYLQKDKITGYKAGVMVNTL